ncbi:MAG: hypothetical protein COX81_00195, partial [Candidatus Magasanikbacteria bacterium CG_4_10_14_0_2_um_filter_37_12]
MDKIKRLLKKKTFWFVAVPVILVVLFFIKGSAPKPVGFSSSIVERMNLLQSVSETGSVVAKLEIAYGWEVSGQVSKVYKEVGDEVKKGEVIAELSNAQQSARLNEAYSALASAQAKLNLEYAGPSDEERNKSLASIDQA